MSTTIRHILALGLVFAAAPAFADHGGIVEVGFDEGWYTKAPDGGEMKVTESTGRDPVAEGKDVSTAYDSTAALSMAELSAAPVYDHQSSRQFDAGG